MKGLLVVLMMICPMVALGQAKAAKESFPIHVHVTASKFVVIPSQLSDSGGDLIDELTVIIDGKKYLWAVPTPGRRNSLLLPGNYKARVISDKHYAPYEVNRRYKMLLPDGKTINVTLMGVIE